MHDVEVLIIGAGVSGLAYANFTNEDYIIIEKENEPGGLCKTIYDGEYVWDYAGHFFHFFNPTIKSLFDTHICHDDIVVCNKNTNIYYNGNIIDYPFQMNIHQLPKDEFIECLYDLFFKKETDVYDNFEEMLYGKFGRGIVDRFLKPYNEKLYACDLNSLDTNAMGRFFPYAKTLDIIGNMKENKAITYNSTFNYPKRGAITFINILLKKINKQRLFLNHEVSDIDLEHKIAVINGEKVKYKKLINTIPFSQFIKFLPENYRIIGENELHANKVLVFNMGFDKQAINREVHWTYFPDKDINFYRVGYYSNILHATKLSIYVEIGFSSDAHINFENQLKMTLENLKKCGIIDTHKLVAYNVLVIDPAYVHVTNKSKEFIDNTKLFLEKKGVYTIGRYGAWTYCSIEDCMIEAKKLTEK